MFLTVPWTLALVSFCPLYPLIGSFLICSPVFALFVAFCYYTFLSTICTHCLGLDLLFPMLPKPPFIGFSLQLSEHPRDFLA